MWDQNEIAKARQILSQQKQQQAIDDYARQKETIDAKHSNAQTGLSGLLANLTRDFKSVGNTLNTTLRSVPGALMDMNSTNTNREATMADSKKDLDAIAQKYGYKDKDDAFDKGDGPEEMWKEFQDSTSKTRKAIENISDAYKDSEHRKAIENTSQSQYGADALRTLNLIPKVVGVGAGPLGGVAVGAVEGIADSLENANGNVLDIEADISGGKIKSAKNADIDLADMAKRAAVGGIVGAASAGVANKLGNAKSAIGSNLLNNKLATSAVGRGALVGGAAGALGGGINAGLEGGDILGSAIQGAGSGAITGGVTSGITSGTRKVGTALTNKLGITDNIAAARQRLMMDRPEETEVPNTGKQKTAKEIIDDVEQQGGFRTKTARERVADTAERTGEFLEGVQASLNRTDKKNIGVKNTGKVINNVRKKTGLNTIQDQAEFARQITGGENSILDKYQRRALAYREDGKPFMAETSDIYAEIPNIVKKNITSASTSANKPNQLIENFRQDLRENSGDLLGLANRYKSAAAASRRSSSAAEQAEAQVFEAVARAIDDASYKAIPKANVEAMFDASIDELNSRANLARQQGDKKTAKAYSTAAAELDKQPRTIQAFRSYKKDFVDAANINDKAVANDNTGSTNMARGIRGWANTAKDLVLEKPVKWGAAKAGAIISNQADKIRSGGSGDTRQTTTPTTQTISPDLVNMYSLLGMNIGRNEGASAGEGAIKNREYKTLEDQLAQNMANAQSVANYQPQSDYGASVGTEPQSGIEWQLQNIVAAMDNAMAAGDLSAYSQLASLYKTAYDIYKTQGGATTTQTKLTEKQQKANAAEELLNELEGLTPDYGYAVRDIPVLNLVNARGNTYSNAADGLATALGYMMSGATVTPQEYERIKEQYVPQPWDSEDQRQIKLQRARNVISQYQNATA